MTRRRARPVAVLIAAVAGASSLGGCSSIGDGYGSTLFVDPAKYELFDCERLKTTRASLATQVAEKQALIDKARTGTGGAFIGEAAYRNDYLLLKASQRSADEHWQRNGCDAVVAPPPAAPAPRKR